MDRIAVGMATCGLVAGAEQVASAARRWADAHGRDLEVVPTGCLGFCQAEPILDIFTPAGNRLIYGYVKAEEVGFILDETLIRGHYIIDGLLGQHPDSSNRNAAADVLPGVPLIQDHPFFKLQHRIVLRNCGVVNPESLDDYTAYGGFAGLTRSLGMAPAKTIAEVMASGLRGRGGGGYPTGQKWRQAAETESAVKYIVCNADEGDPGGYGDRAILESDPFAVIEGMMIAGFAVGAGQGVLYCRSEYSLAAKRASSAVEAMEKAGLLSQNGFRFSVSVVSGAGAFVCGEETALIASIEGKRGMPRPRPPYPAVSGLYNKPTVVNNVETFANVSWILKEGPDAMRAIGTDTTAGTKVFSLSGDVVNSGLVEVPMGISLREIVYQIGGGATVGFEVKAVLTGGAAGGFIPENTLDLPVDYESLGSAEAHMGSGSLVVLDNKTCMVDLAKYLLSISSRESCGKCIPCREGTQRIAEILDQITKAYSDMNGEEENLHRFHMVFGLEDLASVIRETSLCRLGQLSVNPVLSLVQHFREELDAHIYDRRCPAGRCAGLALE